MKNGTQDDTGSVYYLIGGIRLSANIYRQAKMTNLLWNHRKTRMWVSGAKKKRINEKNPAPRVFICITFHTRLKIISDSLSVRLPENTNHWACREYKMINFFSLTRFWSRATGFVTSLLYGPVLQKEHV